MRTPAQQLSAAMKSSIAYAIMGVLLAALSFFAYTNYKARKNLEELTLKANEELQRANLQIGRAQTQLGDANTQINKLNKQLKDEISKREAVMTMYAELEAAYKAEQQKVKIVTRVIYKDQELPVPKGQLFIKTENGFESIDSLKFNYKDFRITITGDALKEQISYSLHQKFKGIFVETKLPTGGYNHYAEIRELNDKGEEVGKMELKDFKVLKSNELSNHMMWWNPKIDLMAGYSLSGKSHGVSGELGFSISAHGKTSNDINWRFFRFGVGLRQGAQPTLTFSPVLWNAGSVLPVISNLWLSPTVGADFTERSWLVNLGLGVVF